MEICHQNVREFDKRKFTFDKELGSGSFGRVRRATIADSKLGHVAVKMFYPELQISQTKRKVYAELDKVGSLGHINVVKLIGLVEDDIPWLVFEYMEGGSLLDFVIGKKNIKEKVLVRYCRDIARGMAYLHQNNIIHKDLAARNVLLDGKIAKIADMGLSSVLTPDQHGINYILLGKMLAYRHAAFECVVEGFYSYQSDVWSMGILMWEIWTGGETPYGQELKEADVRRFIAEGGNPMHKKFPSCSPNLISLMENILQKKKEKRPTFHELRFIFEHIKEGGQYQGISFSKSEPERQNNQDEFQYRERNALSGRQDQGGIAVNQNNLLVRPNVKLLQNASSTPNLQIQYPSRPPKKSLVKTASGEFLDVPYDNHSRRRSDMEGAAAEDRGWLYASTSGVSELSSSVKNENLFPQKSLFSSANNLNQRLGKSQSDIRDEMLKDLGFIEYRFQKRLHLK